MATQVEVRDATDGTLKDVLLVADENESLADARANKEEFEAWFESERAVKGLHVTRDKPAAWERRNNQRTEEENDGEST